MDQAEQLRNIIKAKQNPQRPLARVITVTSGKGGVGKSNTSSGLILFKSPSNNDEFSIAKFPAFILIKSLI